MYWANYKIISIVIKSPSMKILIFIFITLFSYISFSADKSKNDNWFAEAKKYYYDYNIALEEYKNKNYTNAFKLLYSLAKGGDSRAQSDIAGMYFNGWGVVKDLKMAFQWYKKSSLNGNPYAQYKLGDMYWNGLGVKTNTDTAQIWWKKAADNGYKDAQFNLPYQYCHMSKPQCQ